MSRDDASLQVVDAPRHDRLADDLGRPVALVGDADELVAEADGADDLGRRRQERDDAHAGPVSRLGRLPRGPASRELSAALSSSTAARAAALSVNQVASIGGVVRPLGRQRLLGEDRVDRALRLAGAAVDALVRVDEQLAIHALVVVDAVDRADGDARDVEHVDARLGDHVGHSGPPRGRCGTAHRGSCGRERTTATRSRCRVGRPSGRGSTCPLAQWPGMWQPTIQAAGSAASSRRRRHVGRDRPARRRRARRSGRRRGARRPRAGR